MARLSNSGIQRSEIPIFDAIVHGRCAANQGSKNTNDRANLQALINDMPSGAELKLRRKLYISGGPIEFPRSITITGTGAMTSGLVFVGSSGLSFASGVSNVTLRDFGIAAASRHTTTPNSFIGIDAQGATNSRPSNWEIKGLLVDGFSESFRSNFLWSSTFDTFRSLYAGIGLHVRGLSVNNFVSKSFFASSGVSGSKAIFLDGAAGASEGWSISQILTYGVKIGIHGISTCHVKVADSIIDYCSEVGILLADNGTNVCSGWEIHDNWIGMGGSTATAAIHNANTVANARFLSGNEIRGNRFAGYEANGCQYGYLASHANAGPDKVRDNKGWWMAQAMASAVNSPAVQMSGNTFNHTPAPALGAEVRSSPLRQVFATGGAWSKPAGARRITIAALSGGGGGGSGRRGAASTVRCGGGGGSGGHYVERTWDAGDVPNTLTVVVGAGGAGGPSVATDDTNGAAGTAGGRSEVSNGAWKFGADGGASGGGGTATAGAGGAGPNNGLTMSPGRAASTTGGAGQSVTSASISPTLGGAGGGSGGGITAADAASIGGSGGPQAGWSSTTANGGPVGANGVDGAPTPANMHLGGAGGGGGGSSVTAAGGKGGNGGGPGGGGGGGGASVNGQASGAGGNGADGLIVITVEI